MQIYLRFGNIVHMSITIEALILSTVLSPNPNPVTLKLERAKDGCIEQVSVHILDLDQFMLQIRVGMATPETVPPPQPSPAQEVPRAHVRV